MTGVVGGRMNMTRKEETINDDGMEMTKAVGQMELTRLGQMEMTNIVGSMGMDMTRMGGAMEMTNDVRRLISDHEDDVNTSHGSDSVFLNNSKMAEFHASVSAATSVTTQPRVDELPGSEPASTDTSTTAEADLGGGATATVKFSVLSLANNTLVLPRKESEEDEMTSCPVQYFSYDPAEPIQENLEEQVVNPNISTSRPPILKSTEASICVPGEQDVTLNVQNKVTPVQSTESLIPSSNEQSKATDESGWETMHSMIGLPPVTEPSLTPDIRVSSIRTSNSWRSTRSSVRSIEEDQTLDQKTACLGGLMMQRSRKFSDPDVSVFAPGEESTRAFRLPSVSASRTAAAATLDLGDISSFSPDIESTRALPNILPLPRTARQSLAGHPQMSDEDEHEACLVQSKTGKIHPLVEKEESPPKRMRRDDQEDIEATREHQRSSLRNCLQEPLQGEAESHLSESENCSEEASPQFSSQPTEIMIEDKSPELSAQNHPDAGHSVQLERSVLRNCLKDPSISQAIVPGASELESCSQAEINTSSSTSQMDAGDISRVSTKEPMLVENVLNEKEAVDVPRVETKEQNLVENVLTEEEAIDEINNLSLKERRNDVQIEESTRPDEIMEVEKPSEPQIVQEVENVVKEIELSIFEDLKSKHAAAGKRNWELVRSNEKLAAFGFLEKSLLLVLTLGEKLEPRKSRKSLGRIVHHWSIRDIRMVSTHRGDAGAEEDEDDTILDTGKVIHTVVLY